jgi:hypothetical protein
LDCISAPEAEDWKLSREQLQKGYMELMRGRVPKREKSPDG